MLPLNDNNPTHITPYVTYALIAANVLTFVIMLMLPDNLEGRVKFSLGAIPAIVFQIKDIAANDAILPSSIDFLSILSSQFLHAGWWHLIGNMLYLWVFGNQSNHQKSCPKAEETTVFSSFPRLLPVALSLWLRFWLSVPLFLTMFSSFCSPEPHKKPGFPQVFLGFP